MKCRASKKGLFIIMEIIDIEEVIEMMTKKIENMRENGELAPEDEFTLMQPLANRQMVTVIDNPDEPDITVITVTPVSDSYHILPKINKRLVYNTEGKGKDIE